MREKQRLRQPSPLRFESLERRSLLAGDVTAAVVDGRLVVTGDDFGNNVSIHRGDTPNEIVVQAGGSLRDLTTTTINGGSRFVATGVTGLIVHLGDGDDTLSVRDVDIAGDVVIDTGMGDDDILLNAGHGRIDPSIAIDYFYISRPVLVSGKLVVMAGAGNDLIHQGTSTIGGSEHISAGEGDDRVWLHDFAASSAAPAKPVEIGRSLTINMGADDGINQQPDSTRAAGVNEQLVVVPLSRYGDRLVARALKVHGNLVVIHGKGTADLDLAGDVDGSALIVAGGGNDRINLGSKVGLVGGFNVGRNLLAHAGAGDDIVVQASGHIKGDEILVGGDGRDRVNIGSATPFDAVSVSPALFIDGTLRVNLGAGDDRLSQTNSSVSGSELVSMGAGADAVFLQSHNNFTDSFPSLITVGQRLLIDGQEGDDTVSLRQVAVGTTLDVDDRDGQSRVSMSFVQAMDVQIESGDGADTVELRYVTSPRVTLATGAGADSVTRATSLIDRFFADLGDGDDELNLGLPTTTLEFAADGGAGFDTLVGGERAELAGARNFEEFLPAST